MGKQYSHRVLHAQEFYIRVKNTLREFYSHEFYNCESFAVWHCGANLLCKVFYLGEKLGECNAECITTSRLYSVAVVVVHLGEH